MNRFKTRLVGFGIAIGLLALPLMAGAESDGKYSSHRYFTQEVVETMQYEPTADYAMLERSRLEDIAGRDNLDWQTIQFLEDNLWDHDILAQPVGDADETGIGVYGIDMGFFSNEIPWQDKFEDVAEFAADEAENLYPEADDVPQLEAGVLTY